MRASRVTVPCNYNGANVTHSEIWLRVVIVFTSFSRKEATGVAHPSSLLWLVNITEMLEMADCLTRIVHRLLRSIGSPQWGVRFQIVDVDDGDAYAAVGDQWKRRRRDY